MSFLSVSELAREIGCRPRDISDAFYSRVLDDSRCPLVAGRRLVPRDYVPEVQRVLGERGRLTASVD